MSGGLNGETGKGKMKYQDVVSTPVESQGPSEDAGRLMKPREESLGHQTTRGLETRLRDQKPRTAPLWLPTLSLLRRELVRFGRQRSRVVGVVASPLLFWVVIGSGFSKSFRPSGGANGYSYLQYFFPGTIVMIILFTSIFCMMSVIEDRNEGFLQSVLVSPVSRAGLVLGKLLGGTLLASIEGVILLPLAPLIGIRIDWLQAILLIAILLLISFGLTALGFVFAWRINSIQGFHAIMNVFLIPMWLLSGALFPISGASRWVAWVMRINPLTYNMVVLQRVLYANHPLVTGQMPGMGVALGVTLAFGAVMFFLAIGVASKSA